jgi:hypothetical protein
MKLLLIKSLESLNGIIIMGIIPNFYVVSARINKDMREVEKKAYYKYFDKDGFIINSLKGLPRKNSPMSLPIQKDEYTFEVLKLDGDNEIRFAIQKEGDCSCRNFITDRWELIHVRDWLEGKCGCKPDLFDEFRFNIYEEYQLRKLLSDAFD